MSGDDDLFIGSLPSATRIGYCLSKSSWTWSIPEKSWLSLIRQKRRHLTTAPSYQLTTRIWLMSIFLSHLTFYSALFYLVTISWYFLFIWFLRLLIIHQVIHVTRQHLDYSPHKGWLPILDLFQVLFYLSLSFSFLFPKKKW